MQMACIEGARNTVGIEGASTTEFGETSEPVVGLITEWMSAEGLQERAAGGDLGGTMRLGAYPAKLDGNSVVRGVYGQDEISERHRHRYEVNIHYKDALEKEGLVFSGMSPDGRLPEIVERPDRIRLIENTQTHLFADLRALSRDTKIDLTAFCFRSATKRSGGRASGHAANLSRRSTPPTWPALSWNAAAAGACCPCGAGSS